MSTLWVLSYLSVGDKNMDLTRVSRYLSLILRHKPEVAGIELDKHGWAKVSELLPAMKIDMETLEEIVRTDEKGRYSFNDDHSKIRANQGHSIDVDVELERQYFMPAVLYHGTSWKNVDSIMKTGINSGGRKYVHLSGDKETALKVGKRHGKPVVLEIDTFRMHINGFIFYKSKNGVYLTEHVPAEYITILKE